MTIYHVYSTRLLDGIKPYIEGFALANKDLGTHSLFHDANMAKIPYIVHGMGDKGSIGRHCWHMTVA